MNDIIRLLLAFLAKDPNEIAKKKYGKCPQITYEELLLGILKYNSLKDTKEYLGISEQTLNRLLKKCFPNVVLHGGGETWKFYLLSLVDYKYCNKCREYKHYSLFLKEAGCKACRNIYNVSDNNTISNRISQQRYYYENKSYFRTKSALYRAAKLQRTVSWDQKSIKDFYKKCPEGYHVDHIIPLQGKYVSGLHVLSNLQYLSKKDNLQKSNYHISEQSFK